MFIFLMKLFILHFLTIYFPWVLLEWKYSVFIQNYTHIILRVIFCMPQKQLIMPSRKHGFILTVIVLMHCFPVSNHPSTVSQFNFWRQMEVRKSNSYLKCRSRNSLGIVSWGNSVLCSLPTQWTNLCTL